MSGVHFNRESDEVSCGKSVKIRSKRGGRYDCGCLRVRGHKGKCVAMACDAAKADGVCFGCRAEVGCAHRLVDKKTRLECDAAKVMVECAFCLARFGSVLGYDVVSYGQGDGCASSVDSNRILCGYGSDYDGEIYEFADGVPIGFKDVDPVCDGCIRGFLEQGAIVKTGEYL